jgi:2'-5' RNA ligase
MRLFIAIDLPADLRERLAALSNGFPGARWVAPENLHLTLRFIGEADGAQAQDIDAALTGLRVESFPVTLAGLGRFGNGTKLRALWVGVEVNPALEHLQAKVEQALRRAGLPPEGRKFKPHVTLARFKAGSNARLRDYLEAHALFRAEAFEVRNIVLYSSFLSPNGAIHTPEAVYPLQSSAAGMV